MTEAAADEEPMMLLGGEIVPLSRYQAHVAAPVIDPVQVVPAPAAGAPSIGQAGLTIQPSVPDPSPLSDNERNLVWAVRLGLIKIPSLPVEVASEPT